MGGQFSLLLSAEVCGIRGSNAGYTVFRGSVKWYWLPTAFASFPFTSPPVPHRVPSHFNWTVPRLHIFFIMWKNRLSVTYKKEFETLFQVYYEPRYFSRYSDTLRAGRSRDRIPVEARFPVPFQTGPGGHTTSYTMDTGTFPGVERPGRGVDPHLATRLKKEHSYTSPPLPGVHGPF